MLKDHGRYDYSAITERPDYSFPGGKRLAVHLCINVEHFSYGEGRLSDYAGPHPMPNTRAYAWHDYGNRVGAWRLLELANAYELPYAILTNSAVYDYCPQLLAAFRERGDEFVGHGRTNSERQVDMSDEEERACIFEATATLEKHEGRKPMGWLAPFISQTHNSLDLLKEAGYRYMLDWPLDDQPVWFRTKHGKILSIPYAHDLNDGLETTYRQQASQLQCESMIDQFDEMLEESKRRPLVMSIILHTMILGQPYRLRHFRRVIEHVTQHRDRVWITHPGRICEFIESLPAGVVPGS